MNSRISVGIAISLIFLVSLTLGGVPLFVLMLFISCYSAFEMWRMCRKIGRNFYLPAMLLVCSAFIVEAFVSKGTYSEIILICALIISFASNIFKEKRSAFFLDGATLCMFVAVYCGLSYSKFILIRDIGMELAIFTLFLVWINDVFCFIVGKNFGKHKLAPNISPKKTVEGALGGIILTPAVAVIFKYLVVRFNFIEFPNLSYTAIIVIAIIISILGQLGDLGESAIKRQANVKDSGSLLKAHGGILDRFDSFILTIPFMYYVYLFLL